MKDIKIRQILQLAFVVFIVVVVLRLFIVDSFIVKGDSMAPTILSGDYVFVEKVSRYFKNDFGREDIIVLKPRLHQEKIIKRIIGLPGERIEIKNEGVFIKNSLKEEGVSLSEQYINLPSTSSIGLSNIKLDQKEYFVLGDNRQVSIDSRELGPVDEWDIEGRVFLVFRIKSFSIKLF